MKNWKAPERESAKLMEEWWRVGTIIRTGRSGSDRRVNIGSDILQTADHTASDKYFLFHNEVKAEERSKAVSSKKVTAILKEGKIRPKDDLILATRDLDGNLQPARTRNGWKVPDPNELVIEGRKVTKGQLKGMYQYTVDVKNRPGWEITSIAEYGNQHFSVIGDGKNDGYYEQAVKAAWVYAQAKEANTGRQYPRIPLVLMTRSRFPWWVMFPSYLVDLFGLDLSKFTVPVLTLPELAPECRVHVCLLSGFLSSTDPQALRRRYWLACKRRSLIYQELFRRLRLWDEAVRDSGPF